MIALLLSVCLLISTTAYSPPLARRSFLNAGLASPVAIAGLASPAFAATTLPEEFRQGTLGADGGDGPLSRNAYKTLSSGVVYADLRGGTDANKVVKEGSRVNVQWVLRKANGYFVDSSEVSSSVPFIFTVGSGNAIPCVDEGVRGMAQGASRRLICPIPTTYTAGVEDGKPGPVPVGFGPKQQIRRVMTVRKDVPGEYIFFELQVTRVS